MKRIDEFLTRKAQAVWSGALVYRETESGEFVLERPAVGGGVEKVQLDRRFGRARAALSQVLRAELARRKGGAA